MSNKTYSRPDFTMMRFALSDNVASAACSYYKTINIPCLISGNHDIFYDSCGTANNYYNLGSSIIPVESTLYFQSAMDAINYLSGKSSDYSTTKSNKYSYELAAGEYLIWTSGQTHAAYITGTSLETGINSSN